MEIVIAILSGCLAISTLGTLFVMWRKLPRTELEMADRIAAGQVNAWTQGMEYQKQLQTRFPPAPSLVLRRPPPDAAEEPMVEEESLNSYSMR